MISHVLILEGVDSEADLDRDAVRRAAQLAINKTLDRTRTASAREIRNQVAFPHGYLEGPQSRLNVVQRATADRLEGIITGRHRPTSLARFAKAGRIGTRGGVRVTVKPGTSQSLGRAFLLPLRAGTDTSGNLGLALRVPRGTRPDNAFKPVQLDDGLFLLYGPSVDQVFKTVRGDVSPDAATFLEREFSRLLELSK